MPRSRFGHVPNILVRRTSPSVPQVVSATTIVFVVIDIVNIMMFVCFVFVFVIVVVIVVVFDLAIVMNSALAIPFVVAGNRKAEEMGSEEVVVVRLKKKTQ